MFQPKRMENFLTVNKTTLSFVVLFIVALLLTSNTAAQVKRAEAVAGGVVNGKADSLPKPVYPAAARAVKASGAVNVQVTIDENGSVISAEAVSGHPLLRAAAVAAARNAKFSPTKLSGQPVKVVGIIVYNFVLDTDNPAVITEQNLDTVKKFGLGMILTMLRDTKTKANPMTSDPDLKNILIRAAADFPELKQELLPMLTFTDLTQAKQNEAARKIILSLETKFVGADVWRFELGKSVGSSLSVIFNTFDDDGVVTMEKLDNAALKSGIAKISDLSKSAPPEIPAEFVKNLQVLVTSANEQEFQTEQGVAALMIKFEKFFANTPNGRPAQ